jgi:lipoprotein-anchoring transpeptidase ErfK/SrfK
MRRGFLSAACLCLIAVAAGHTPAAGQELTLEAVNKAEFGAKQEVKKDVPSPTIVKAQVLLDRARFSPGVIDGHMGENVKKALAGFQRSNGLRDSGDLDQDTWTKLVATSSDPVLKEHTISDDDVKGPFIDKLPGFEEQAELKRLAYTGPREKLSETFHMDEDLLKALNPKKSFDKEGTVIVVAAVGGPPGKEEKGRVAKIEIDKKLLVLRALDKEGNFVAFYPASIGSGERPAPSGTFTVRAVAMNPAYTYNPKYKFEGVKSDKPFEIAPGPNNPVGSVWIALDKEGYGIHGTPDPDKVSKSYSHGCVRLTNWDAEELARMVDKGTAVAFLE